MKLLFAEDDPDVARGVAAILERNNYLVDVVNNGQDAYDYIMEGDYDAAVLDIMMPKMNGDEVVRRIRKNGKSIPVMLLTAMGEVEDRIDGLDAGLSDEAVCKRGAPCKSPRPAEARTDIYAGCDPL